MSTALLRGFEPYKPVVVAIQGHTLAGDTEVLPGTDLRTASTFGLTEVQRGIVPASERLGPVADAMARCVVLLMVCYWQPEVWSGNQVLK